MRQDEALKAQQAQINEWALGYLSNLGSAASYRGSGGGSGGAGGSGGYRLSASEVQKLRERVLNGDAEGVEYELERLAVENPGALTNGDYSYIWNGIQQDTNGAPSGYDGTVMPGRQYGGIVSKGRDTRLN